MKYHLSVYHRPVGQPRHRGRSMGRKGVHLYIPTQHPIHGYKAAIQAEAMRRGVEPIDGPVSVSMVIQFERPKSHTLKSGKLAKRAPRYMVSKPDVDNICKAGFDCLNGIAWHDDAQIVQVTAIKQWGDVDLTEMTIESFADSTR